MCAVNVVIGCAIGDNEMFGYGRHTPFVPTEHRGVALPVVWSPRYRSCRLHSSVLRRHLQRNPRGEFHVHVHGIRTEQSTRIP